MYKSNNTVFLSLYIEKGGEYCDIVKLSAELFRLLHSDDPGKKKIQPAFIHFWDTFNKYIKSREHALWGPAASNIHGLHAEA